MFFGPRGTEAQKWENLGDFFKMEFGSQDCCFPNDVEACRAAATWAGFRVGLIFAGDWSEGKGCDGYVDGPKGAQAFFGTGGTEEQNRAPMKYPMIRLGGTEGDADCADPEPLPAIATSDAHPMRSVSGRRFMPGRRCGVVWVPLWWVW